ncbi:MAG: uracil-DNA glycosylase family protein [Candidatus Freyarchaeum deiterrae]
MSVKRDCQTCGCNGCILSERKDYIDVRDETLKINAKYVPNEKIKILFVAESPTISFLRDKNRYFYAPGQIRYGGLFYQMMYVLFEEEMKECSKFTKEHFLDRFKMEKGFYLIDMVKCPINKLLRKEKRKAIESCSKYLNKELNSLSFQKVIFIGKSSFKEVKAYLDLNFNYVVIPLPFGPNNKNVQNFRKELSSLI